MTHDQTRQTLEGSGFQDDLHEELLAQGAGRFPEESFQQLLGVGVAPAEALVMLGFSSQGAMETAADRQRLQKLSL